jgi:hypothetical protein
MKLRALLGENNMLIDARRLSHPTFFSRVLSSPVLLSSVLIVVASLAGTAAEANDDVRKDLQAVIALQGKPCGQVSGATKQGVNDYIADCSNGKRYRISANDAGRVTVKEL